MGVVRHGVTTEWLNVFLEVNRRLEAALNAAVGLTMTQYRILLELDATADRIRSADLAKMLLLRPSSITIALSQLEARGYVSRLADPSDRRATVISITPEGKGTEVRASAELAKVRKNLWRALTERQVAAVIESTRLASERLHATGVTMGTLIEPFYTTAITTALRMFAAAVKDVCGIPLTEFRILSELSARGEKMRGSDLASRLFLDESVISVATRTLTSGGLVEQEKDPADKRNRLLSLTPEGEQCAERGAQAIARVNQEIYGDLDEKLLAEVIETAVIINDSI
jgi:DNA-binding MarR family transcriptional regulator